MDSFMQSKDGHWWYGGYVTVDEEEFKILDELAKENKVPHRIMAGILLRERIRSMMNIKDYADTYHTRMIDRRSREHDHRDSGVQKMDPYHRDSGMGFSSDR